MNRSDVDLSVNIGRMTLKNPVMPSAGTFGYGEEFANFLNLEDLGAIVVNRISYNPKMGNFPDRTLEIAGSGFLVTIGQQNPGIEKFIKEKLPYLRQFSTPVVVNIAGETVEQYAQMAEMLSRDVGVSALEINMACPNLKAGGMSFAADPDAAFNIVREVRNATDLSITAKLVPTVVDVAVLAKACEEAGADGICPVHAPIGMAIDIRTKRSRLGRNLTGALQSPSHKPVTIRMVWQAAQAVDIPVIGCGGVTCAEDAIEFFIAGATAVQIGTYNVIDPRVTIKTIEGIRQYLIDNGHKSVKELIGTFSPP
ncbi:MAG: dihydroorotate dehydrogenase [Deltaproteobacteria bacterium]|nr:dihydroorotate dehydrogenase [Deltaproteobacteria bacterium]